ncbi:MAG: NAD(P)H-dependent oxidoreductase [Hyphomonadaceae bacterium]|nr:NAD(P)H-dependent oxidoreductase [Hyphomonadaceae bacterium]
MHKVLVIDGHPDRGPALCHALADAYVEGAREGGRQTRLIRLAEASFPVLRSAAAFAAAPNEPDIVKAREDVMWADHLVFVFPLWLGSAPAYVRAFLEQIARGGFVADIGPRGWRPGLKGKSARLIVTMGMPALAYRLMFGAHGVKSLEASVLGFAGVRPVRASLLGMIEGAPEMQRRRIARVRALGAAGR